MAFLPTDRKIRRLDEAVPWRRSAAGVTVFTNGVFDLVHAGHVALLESARALGDRLVVGINGDGSARSLAKGTGRPFVPATERVRIIAALAAVDCVVVFDEPTPRALIAALEPDVLVKGGDYLREDVVGADLVEAGGGRVVLIPIVPNQSTTLIVERIRGSR